MKCNMVTKPTGRPEGRPPKPLAEDDERYLAALLRAPALLPSLAKQLGFSERGFALSLTAARRGTPVRVDEDGALVFALNPDERRRGAEGDKEPRNQSAFHPRADDLRRKAARLSTLDGVEGAWFAQMALAWAFCFYASNHLYAFAGARAGCLNAYELPFFDRVMAPIINHRFGHGPKPNLRLPEFIPHDAA
jgi:hypothetical protein